MGERLPASPVFINRQKGTAKKARGSHALLAREAGRHDGRERVPTRFLKDIAPRMNSSTKGYKIVMIRVVLQKIHFVFWSKLRFRGPLEKKSPYFHESQLTYLFELQLFVRAYLSRLTYRLLFEFKHGYGGF